jgi:hypothetical protein
VRAKPGCASPKNKETSEDEHCEEPSAHVHHLDGLGPQGPRGFDPENLMALCPRCHALRTRPWEFRPEVAAVPAFEPRATERKKTGRAIFRQAPARRVGG